MVVVSDTSPIVNLAAIGQLDILPALFGKVYIPAAVYAEIVIKGAGQPGAYEIQHVSWVEVCNCANTNLLQELLLELDSGESESIVLAIELNTPTLLMDEKDGREVALRFHLKPIGILGILIEAKKSGLVTSVRDCMDKLKSEAGFYLAESLYARVIELVGE
jgi:hypothetical protein